MATSASFPRALLTQGATARLAHFRRYTVAHARLQQVDRALWRAVHEPGDAALIFVSGPTGVGKTTLRHRLQQLLAAELAPLLHDDPGRLPSMAITAIAPETGAYSWKDHYLASLRALDDPFSTPTAIASCQVVEKPPWLPAPDQADFTSNCAGVSSSTPWTKSLRRDISLM